MFTAACRAIKALDIYLGAYLGVLAEGLPVWVEAVDVEV